MIAKHIEMFNNFTSHEVVTIFYPMGKLGNHNSTNMRIIFLKRIIG